MDALASDVVSGHQVARRLRQAVAPVTYIVRRLRRRYLTGLFAVGHTARSLEATRVDQWVADIE